MAPKKASLRSAGATIVKDFGLLDKLPYRPLSKADILGRFNGIRGVLSFTDTPCYNGDVLSENQTIAKLAAEIVELYGKFKLKSNHERSVQIKIKKIKTGYYKAKKNAQAAVRFNSAEIVSFKADKQLREVLKEDIEWYKAKLQGLPGSLGSVDTAAHKRKINRETRKCKVTDQDSYDQESDDENNIPFSQSPSAESADTQQKTEVPYVSSRTRATTQKQTQV